ISLMRQVRGVRDVLIMGSFSRENGDVPYDGHQYVGVTPVVLRLRATSHATIDDWHLRLGKGFMLSDQWMFTPYAAYGYHSWDRQLQVGSPSGYWEYYNHHVFQYGSRFQFAGSRGSVLTLDGR